MRIQSLLARRTTNTPKDAVMPSHQLLLRGGYIRQIGQGLYTLLPLGRRIHLKIENIIRQEMDAVDGQEITMPVVAPADLWKASGRYESVGGELVRFDDRSGHPHVLNMTHEEVVVDAIANNVESYRQLPLMVYQLQTKFRDEPRSRGGLVRVREFTMKDAYSFHRTAEDLESYYQIIHEAYHKIYQRMGLYSVVDILSDVGMMGGSKAHEFMALSEHGEDTLLLCDSCGYRANREVAKTTRTKPAEEPLAELVDVETPAQKTIEEVAAFLKIEPTQTAKAVLFMADADRPIAAFVRGDLEVNAAKLRNTVKAGELRPMQQEELESIGAVAGYTGPIGLSHPKLSLVIDTTIIQTPNLAIGANKANYHKTGFNFERDLPKDSVIMADIAEVTAGDPCPECGTALRMTRGIEVGNIFQLGYKYTKSMGCTYLEEDGRQEHPIMGCYGIGVGRALACIVEEHHDEHGPKWPISVAPFTVQVCCIQAKKEGVLEAGDKVYEALKTANIEVLYDDRKVGTGFMFADADLIGAPIRVIVSPRNLKENKVELKYRVSNNPPENLPESAPIDNVLETIQKVILDLSKPEEK